MESKSHKSPSSGWGGASQEPCMDLELKQTRVSGVKPSTNAKKKYVQFIVFIRYRKRRKELKRIQIFINKF